MLLQFSCSNHKSIKNKVTFSLIAGKDNSNEEEIVNIAGLRILRTAVLYGANGSGKSNFLKAIEFMHSMVINSINHQPGVVLNQTPHKLSGATEPSTYEMHFLVEGIVYVYSFTIVQKLIQEEYLYYFPNGKQVKIFERNGLVVNIGSKFRRVFSSSQEMLREDILRDNRLFLSCAANFSKVPEIGNAFRFFKDSLVYYVSNENNWKVYSLNLMRKNPEVKKIFIDLMNAFGTDIKDLDLKYEKKKFDEKELPADMHSALKTLITSKEFDSHQTKLRYEQFETDLETEESTGINKLFELLCPIIDIIAKGRTLIVDELEFGIHEAIAHEIVKLFRKRNNDVHPQLIFTTHDTSLLNLEDFRRDQIWFTQLDDYRSTDLFSLAELKNVRKDENVSKGYIMGKYGGIPIFNERFSEIANRIDSWE